MMTVQSDIQKLVFRFFSVFLLTVFGFGFFQEPPQPNVGYIYRASKLVRIKYYPPKRMVTSETPCTKY